jgi:hypothetical protein
MCACCCYACCCAAEAAGDAKHGRLSDDAGNASKVLKSFAINTCEQDLCRIQAEAVHACARQAESCEQDTYPCTEQYLLLPVAFLPLHVQHVPGMLYVLAAMLYVLAAPDKISRTVQSAAALSVVV